MPALALVRDDEEFDALEYFKNNLPRRPYCANNLKKGLVIRGHDFAAGCSYIQPNPPGRVVWLSFDVDQPDGATGWYDRNAPAPTFSIQNSDIPGSPGNGHAHLLYGLRAPVTTTEAAHFKPLSYLAAVQEGLRRKLDADPGYACLIVKNPINFIESWQVKQWSGLYDLAELADWVDLPHAAELRRRVRDRDYAGLGRNCQLFEELRPIAYRLVRSYWRPGGEEPFRDALRSIAEQQNAAFGRPLEQSEVKSISKSVARWVWRRFTPSGFRQVQAVRGKLGGIASGQSRSTKNKNKRTSALLMSAQGCSSRAVAAALGVNHSTVVRWLK